MTSDNKPDQSPAPGAPRPPKPPRPPLPDEDPNLMMKASSRQSPPPVYAPRSPEVRSGLPRLLVIGCATLIGLLLALYFILQYLIR